MWPLYLECKSSNPYDASWNPDKHATLVEHGSPLIITDMYVRELVCESPSGISMGTSYLVYIWLKLQIH